MHVNPRTLFNVTLQRGQFILDAGLVEGIAEGTEFVVHPSTDTLFKNPLGVLIIEKLGPFSTILKLPAGDSSFILSQPSVALQIKMGRREDLRLYIPGNDIFRPCREAIHIFRDREQGAGSICHVDKPEDADFELAMENEKVIFFFRDQRVTQHGHTRLFEAVESTPDELAPVLRAAAHFYQKLNRTNNSRDINSGVQLELLPRLDIVGGGMTPTSPNVSDDTSTTMEVVVDDNALYRFKLSNNTAQDLYPNLFYFDLSDLSIGKYRPCLPIDSQLTPSQFHTTTFLQQLEDTRLAFPCRKTEEFLL